MRYILKAYVCANGCVKWQDYEGSMDFQEVYTRCPDGCRFAVVETEGETRVLDLYDARTKGLNRILGVRGWPPHEGTSKSYPTLEAAIMATVLGYET